jgi:anti-sigma B factor antagonist
MTLRITITEEKDTVIMAPAGRIDSFSIEELQEGFEQVKETGKSNIILLLRDLEYINSRGVGAFLSFFKWIKEVGGVVRLAEVPPNIMELLNLLGLEGLAKVYQTLPKAVENSGVEISTKEVYARRGEAEEGNFVAGPTTEKSKMPYILAGAGIVIVVILVYLFLQPATRAPGPDGALSSKLEVLERRVAQLEGRGRAPSQSDEKLESLSKSLSERIDQIEKELARLKAEVESAKKKGETASAPKKEQDQLKPASYHVVSKGETLFRIALRYNMTVDEVRRLNNLKPDQPILPGQRLLVQHQKTN